MFGVKSINYTFAVMELLRKIKIFMSWFAQSHMDMALEHHPEKT